jgi:hypothetical protein
MPRFAAASAKRCWSFSLPLSPVSLGCGASVFVAVGVASGASFLAPIWIFCVFLKNSPMDFKLFFKLILSG